MAKERSLCLELTLTLPESLAREATAWGLLTPAGLVELLRAEVRRRRVEDLFSAAERLSVQSTLALSEAELEAEIEAARTPNLAQATFLKRQGSIHAGAGSASADIRRARALRGTDET